MSDLTIHMIGNAHLDPVWLWHWQRGSDEAVATCRAACDLLDDYPQVIFTRGEAWVYEQVRELDPGLFERIRQHIAAGRWSVVNGWWVQPDVNLPSEAATKRTIQLGHQWFRRHLNITSIPVAYNVDSFGHGAYLPRILKEMGQQYYVMMRPDQSEKELPAHLFRWRSPDGHDVVTWRIHWGYLKMNLEVMDGTIQQLIEHRQPGLDHMMCFYGVGDHGGGPTREMVEWILAHRDYAPGIRLAFSSPDRFFAATALLEPDLPVVQEELQMHAIGCYSVCGQLKRSMRQAERQAAQVEALDDHLNHPDPALSSELQRAWKAVCFNQFHDILPGSAVKSAIDMALAQIGEAQSILDRAVHLLLRKHSGFRENCEVTGHRINVVNRLGRAWSGLVSGEVWMDWMPWQHHLEDENGRTVPCQLLSPESLMLEPSSNPVPRLVFPVKLAPFQHKAFRMVPGEADLDQDLIAAKPRFVNNQLKNNHLCVSFGNTGIRRIVHVPSGREIISLPLECQCREDTSDTWSHQRCRFDETILYKTVFNPDAILVEEEGVLITTVRLQGMLNNSPFLLTVSLRNDDSNVYLRLSSNYQEPFTVLKLAIAPSGGIAQSRHRVCGGWLNRTPDGKEVPVNHAIMTTNAKGAFGVVLPDSFAADVDAEAVYPTVIRNSVHALHKSAGIADVVNTDRLRNRPGTDEGLCSINVILCCAPDTNEDTLTEGLDHHSSPPYFWDDFRDGERLARFQDTQQQDESR